MECHSYPWHLLEPMKVPRYSGHHGPAPRCPIPKSAVTQVTEVVARSCRHSDRRGCCGAYSLWRLLATVHLKYDSESSTCVTRYIRPCPRGFTRPHFGVPPSRVRFLLLPVQHSTTILGLLYHPFYHQSCSFPKISGGIIPATQEEMLSPTYVPTSA